MNDTKTENMTLAAAADEIVGELAELGGMVLQAGLFANLEESFSPEWARNEAFETLRKAGILIVMQTINGTIVMLTNDTEQALNVQITKLFGAEA